MSTQTQNSAAFRGRGRGMSCFLPCLLLLMWLLANLGSLLSSKQPKYSTTEHISVVLSDRVQTMPTLGLFMNGVKSFYSHTRGSRKPSRLTFFLILLLCGDVHSNPGPRKRLSQIFPCGYCQEDVSWNQDRGGVGCSNCTMWYHPSCVDVSAGEYNRLSDIHIEWLCYKCKTRNSTADVYHSYELETTNTFDTLSSLDDDSVFMSSFSSTSKFEPKLYSSPLTGENSVNTGPRHSVNSGKHSKSRSDCSSKSSTGITRQSANVLPHKIQNLRTLVVNCNGVSHKKAELENLILLHSA